MFLSPRLTRVVIMVRGTEGVARAANFYHQALGLPLIRVTDDWAELDLGTSSSSAAETVSTASPVYKSNLTLTLQATTSEAHLSTGYTPILTLEVADMNTVIANCVQAGAHLDGPLQYPAYGKVASMRSPDGHIFGLYEPKLM